MLEKIAEGKWWNAIAATGLTIFALGVWTSGANILWKLFVTVPALFLINEAFQMFKKDR